MTETLTETLTETGRLRTSASSWLRGVDDWRDLVRVVLYGREPDGLSSPHRAALPELTAQQAGGAFRRNTILAASALSGLLGSLLIAASAPVFPYTAPSWRLTIPGIPHPGSSLFSGFAFVIGVILMGLGWVGLIGRAERQHGGERRRLVLVSVVFAIWCVPMLLAPPLLSRDVYSYVAQGELASRGIDPTSHGPVYLGRGAAMSAADPVWRTNPAPYGPVAVQASRTIVEVTGHDAAAGVWGFRVWAMIGVAMAALGVGMIARSYGKSPAVAIAIGIANPLVLIHLIGGAHNDAFMLGLMALGLAAFVRRWRVTAVLLLALAVAVKLPAVIALVFVGWNWHKREVGFWRRVLSTSVVMGASAVFVAVLCRLVGVGAGWVTALKNTGKVTSTFSFTTKFGYVFGDGLHLGGLNIDSESVMGLFRMGGLALTAVIGALLLLRSPRIGVVRATGLALTAFFLLGPVIWPWYLPTAFALLAAVGIGRFRPSYLVVCLSAALVVWPTSVNPVYSLSRYQHLLGLGVVLSIAAVAYGAQKLSARVYERRLRRSDIGADSGPMAPGDDMSVHDLIDLDAVVSEAVPVGTLT